MLRFALSIADFGIGYSSVSHLRQLPARQLGRLRKMRPR